MPINQEELIKVLSELANERNLRVTFFESVKGGAIIGLSSIFGSLLLGPLGLGLGGVLGSLYATMGGWGKYKSVAEVIVHDMTPAQQTMLAESCMKVIQDLRVEDAAVLLPLLLNTPSAQQAVLQTMTTYFANEMKLKIID